MNPLRVGQHWPVDPVELRDALGGIVQRGFYANNGPLVRGLDGEFGGRHGAAGAVAFGSAALATMCAARALSLDGVVLAPITAPLALLQGLAWGGASVALLDVAPEGENIDPALLESWDGPVAGVAVTRSSTEPELSPALLALATARGASVLVDATHALGCRVRGDAVGSEGPVHIFGFSDSEIVGAGEGGIVVAQSPVILDRLRDARSFHASYAETPVRPRINGKMGEGAAALIRLGLRHLEARIEANRAGLAAWEARLAGIPGLRLRGGQPGSSAAACWVVLPEHGPESGEVAATLAAEGLATGRVPDAQQQRLRLGRAAEAGASLSSPHADRQRMRWLRLPHGPHVDAAVRDRYADTLGIMLRGGR